VDIAGKQFVKVSGIGFRHRTEEKTVPRQELGDLRDAVLAAVRELVAKGCKISFFIDYYGRQWIEIRSGLLIQRKQKLFLPADVIDQIKTEVRAIRKPRQRAQQAARRAAAGA
jgi:hypothetical protein